MPTDRLRVVILTLLICSIVTGDTDHFLKKTYCSMIRKTRIYQTEELSIHCAGKVNLFEDQVSVNFVG